MPASSCPISTLNDELLQLIAALLDLEDLCNLGRVSSHFHAFANEADDVWKGLYFQTFGSVNTSAASSWRVQFRDRCLSCPLLHIADSTMARKDADGWA